MHRDLRKGDISFSKDAYDILIKRIKNRNEYIELLLENEFDTQIDEDYLWDREDASWAENEDDWNSLWRK